MEECWSVEDRARVLDEVADGLWRFVGRHAATAEQAVPFLADLTGLATSALDTLRYLHLLLSPEAAAFADALPELLRTLRPAAPLRQELSRQAVRGRIAWGATSAARTRSGGGDRTLYASAVPHQQMDRPETRLLVQTLYGMRRACKGLSTHTQPVIPSSETWTTAVGRIESAVETALGDRRLAGIDGQVAARDLTLCRLSRQRAVRVLVQAYECYERLVGRPTPAALVEALAQRVLAPLDDDLLYELWVLLGAATVLGEAGWILDRAGLIGRSAAPFTYRSPERDWTARLRFGHTPGHWRRDSRYRDIFTRYGVSGAVRRPDLIIELYRGEERRHLLLEVKRTRDAQYIADSIYKVLGYLADFEPVFQGQAGTRALLVLWDGCAATPSPSAQTVALSSHRNYRAVLRDLLASSILDHS